MRTPEMVEASEKQVADAKAMYEAFSEAQKSAILALGALIKRTYMTAGYKSLCQWLRSLV